jgi:aspartyl-tRNA(Asn)/glutamyl-tRNA(Gln) amidotransferase subunit A
MDRGSLPPAEAAFGYPSAVAMPLRIGWLTNAWKKIEPEIEAATKEAIEELKRRGAKVSDAQLPEGPYEAAAGTIVAVEAAAAFRNLIESGRVAELADPLGQINGYVYESIAASDYMLALQIRGVCQRKIDELFDDYDVLAAPTLPIAATPLETNLEKDLNFPDPVGGIGNLCGLPAVSLPCGFTSAKLPIGLQFVARARNDRAVVAAANLFQQSTDWHLKRPAIG